MIAGEGRVKIGDKWYEVGEGAFIYIPPDVPHAYENPNETVFRFICIIPTVGEPK